MAAEVRVSLDIAARCHSEQNCILHFMGLTVFSGLCSLDGLRWLCRRGRNAGDKSAGELSRQPRREGDEGGSL